MTAVLRFEKRNFADKITTNGILKGIDNGGLIALKKHNERDEINALMEVKSKQSENINISLSKNNIYFKKMSFEEIEKIKNMPHRANSVGAFELVFDFQDLTESEHENFDVLKHKQLIDGYMDSIGLTQEFAQISYVYHADEKNKHFHIIYNGVCKDSTFGVNQFFNPKVKGDVERDKNGKIIYLIENRGKNKGKPRLDKNGNKIPKHKMIRKNGVQQMQDRWGTYLNQSKTLYSHKKAYTSVLNFSKGVWRKFDEITKQRIYLIREAEKARIKALREEDYENVKEYESLMRLEVEDILNIAHDIQLEITTDYKQVHRKNTLAPKQ